MQSKPPTHHPRAFLLLRRAKEWMLSSSQPPASSTKTFWQRVFDFAEQPILLAMLSVVGGTMGVIFYTPFILLCALCVLLALHRSGSVADKSRLTKVAVYVMAFTITNVILLWAGRRLRESTQSFVKRVSDAVVEQIKGILPPSPSYVGNPAPPSSERKNKTPKQTVEVQIIFKDSPFLTPSRRRRITEAINGFYIYLTGLGYSIERDAPPLGVNSTNVVEMSGMFPGTRLDRSIYLPQNALDDPDRVREYFGLYVFRMLFGTLGSGLPPPDYNERETAATLFSVYYASSFSGHNMDKNKWAGHLWMEALWDSKYPPAEPGALGCEPLKAAIRRR